MKKFKKPVPPHMVLTEARLPNYKIGQVYAWEAHLHEQYVLAAMQKREVTYAERQLLVETFVRENQVLAECVVVCKHCEEEIAQASLSGEKRSFNSEAVQRILQDFGIRDSNGRTPLRRKRSNV